MKIGIVGAGLIVPEFLKAANEIGSLEVCAISGREHNRQRMEELAAQYGIEKVYTDYSEMLESDIEGVYVAVPNHLHYEHGKKAAEKKKHVIVEKPFVSRYEEAVDLIETAEKNGVVVFEAISNQYMPNYEKTRQLLGALGRIRIVQMNYSQYSRRYDAFKQGTVLPVFDPKKSGGALMDLNVYNIHYILGLFGKPSAIHYIANVERGIDTSGILTMEYPGFLCVCVGAKDCKAPCSINIQGDRGYLHSDSPANVYGSFCHGTNDGIETGFALNGDSHRFRFELEKFVQLTEKADREEIRKVNEHSLDVMAVLDEARRQAGILF